MSTLCTLFYDSNNDSNYKSNKDMASISYFIECHKVKNDLDKPTQLFLRYDHNGRKKLFSTKTRASISNLNWVEDRGRKKIKIQQPLKKSFHGYLPANKDLKAKYESLYAAMTKANEEGDASIENVGRTFGALAKNNSDVKTIIQGIDKYVEMYSSEYEPRSIANYDNNLRLHISNYNKYKKKEFTLLDLNHEFELGFKDFLRKNENLGEPSVDNTIKYLKSLSKKLENFDIKVNPNVQRFKRISKNKVDKDIIALTLYEINKLVESKELKSPELNVHKDLFIFQCFTGLRISDLFRFSSDMINDKNRIRTRAFKTHTVIEVPILPEAQTILDKYEMKLPKVSEPNYNKGIKKVFKEVGIDRKIESHGFAPIHEIASSHLAKKTFISYCLNEKKLSPIEVSKITGTNVDTVLRYYASASIDEIESKLSKRNTTNKDS